MMSHSTSNLKQQDSKKSDLVKNTVIVALGTLSVQLTSFLLLPFYTAYLSTRDYGIVDLILTYNILLVPVVPLQLGMGAFRFLIDARKDEQKKREIITSIVQLSSLFTLMFALATLAAMRFWHVAYAGLALGTVCAAIAPALFLQFARGFGQNKTYALGSFIAGAMTITLNVILIAGFHMGARGMLLATIIGNLVAAVFLFMKLRLFTYIDLGFRDRSLLARLLRYALPLVPNGISWWIIDASDRTIISWALGLSANGIYAVAYKFPLALGSIASFFSMSWTESASTHINSPDKDAFFSEVSSASVRFFGCLSAATIVYVALLFNMLIGKSFKEAYMYIPILMIAAFFNAVVINYSAIYIAKKMTKQVANTSIASAAINIVLSLATVKLIGLYGTALATAVAYMSMAVYRHHDIQKSVRLTYEPYLFVKVLGLFSFASVLYYYNSLILNVVNALVVTGVSIVMNRTILVIAKDKLFAKLKRLSPEQEAASRSF